MSETPLRSTLTSLGFCLSALAFLLPGCGPAEEFDPETGEAIDAVTVCAKGATVEGIDVSVWQGSVDWAAVKQSGIAFAIARVSYGTSKDTWFDTNWSGMKSAGLVRGAYQFFLPQQDAIAQADLMLKAIGQLGAGDLPPVLDVEDTGGQSAATITNKIHQWADHIEAAIGKKPIIYTGKYFWQDNVASADFSSYPLWIPNYSFNCPNLPDGYWNDWLFFQYTSTGSVPGVSGNVDRNKFNGTLQDLLNYANSGPKYAAKFVSQSFPYVSQGPQQVYAGEVFDSFIEMQNTGTATWDSNTRLATSEPRDRTSPFAGAEWLGPNRYASVTGTVPPGSTYKFQFKMHAPTEPGVYDEHFGLVQEGVAWFSDPGQGGPPDTQLEGLFEVLPAAGTGGAGGAGGGWQSGTGGAGQGGGGSDGSGGSVQYSNDLELSSSCAVSPGRSAGELGSFVSLLGLGLLVSRRRRSR